LNFFEEFFVCANLKSSQVTDCKQVSSQIQKLLNLKLNTKK